MRKRSFRKDLKAVSPVIATIIIVSVAIVMSIAVAYWMLGMGTAFTRYEKLEFTSIWGYEYTDTEGKYYDIKIEIKNTGSATLTVDQVFLNGKPPEAYDVITGGKTKPTVQIEWKNTTLEPGQETTGTISLRKGFGAQWEPGMTVEVVLRTKSGGEYPKMVRLP